jgi:hypothetical protein
MLSNHCPAFQFSGDQYFSNLRSCVHLFDFPPAELSPKPAFAMIQLSARRDSGLIFAAAMVIPFVRQVDQPAGIAKTLLYEKDLKVRELSLSGTAKHPIGAWIDPADYLPAYFLPHFGQQRDKPALSTRPTCDLPTPKIAAICRTVSVGRHRLAASTASCIVMVSFRFISVLPNPRQYR